MTLAQIRCPGCKRVLAEQNAAGIRIKARGGRQWQFNPGAELQSAYCPDCHEWVTPLVENTPVVETVGAA